LRLFQSPVTIRLKIRIFFNCVTYAVLYTRKLLEYCDIAIVMEGRWRGGGWGGKVNSCHNLKTTLTVRRIVSNFYVVAIIYNYRILFGSTFKIQSNRPANRCLPNGLFRIFVIFNLCPFLQQRFLVLYICGFEFHLTCTKKSTGGRHTKRSAFVCGWDVMVSDGTFGTSSALFIGLFC